MILYSEDINGLIMSWADRYPFTQELYHQVIQEWDLHKNDIRVDPKYWQQAGKDQKVKK